MFVTMCINLIAIRLLLKNIGIVDYGIYNVVGGIVTTLSFISASLSSGTQRFYAFYLGKNDYNTLNKTHSVSILLFVIITIVAILLAETIGLWFVKTQLIIPQERMTAALWVYQSSIVSFVAYLLLTPFSAMVLSNEKMGFYSIISICDSVIKLLIVIALTITENDRLIIYAVLLTVVSLFDLLAYIVYCKNKFKFLKHKFIWEGAILRELFVYCGWYTFGSLSVVFRSQGINMLLSMFFSPVVNAARGIAFSVNNAVNNFVNSFYAAVRPQIMKRYAAGETDSMMSLVFKSTKLSYYLIILISIPLYIEMPFILELWLNEVPENATLFTRLVVITAIIETLSLPLNTAICSNGNIKWFQIITGSITLLNLPISYFLLRNGYSPQTPMIIAIILAFLSHIVRFFFMKVQMRMSGGLYLLLIGNIILVTITSLLPPVLINHILIESNYINFGIVLLTSLLATIVSVWFIGLDKEDKNLVKSIVFKK